MCHKIEIYCQDDAYFTDQNVKNIWYEIKMIIGRMVKCVKPNCEKMKQISVKMLFNDSPQIARKNLHDV